ncbi:class IIb bacteriocin, lactobin A/cerein 7B family [Chryseobacterium nematophagum]|nr:class IIb bacteriocin, lactobin A/cerein 7B family [Chryseobacterium nematophagum]
MKNLKVEELSSQEMKNVEGGFFPLIMGGIAGLGWLGVTFAAAGIGGMASAVSGWGVTQFLNGYWG